MDKKFEVETSIDLVSLVNSHEKPFVVIDKDFQIMAVNQAYELEYGTSRELAVGKKCFQISHGKDHPCSIDGEECPHDHVFNKAESKVCTHIHYDANHNMHHVKVTAFPLRTPDYELFLGESIEDISQQQSCVPGNGCMVGESAAYKKCVQQLSVAASSSAPVLLQGETGTGKELAAEYIHTHSIRKLKPFQIVDSTVLTDSLFESEMFGHADGAYTGSVGSKQGLFELAEGGTLFLDEIGDMPVSQQAKLLRVLESGQYRRVGGKSIRRADVRIICASNRNLWQSVLAGEFREDLYYRIACLNIRIPSLYERIEDVPAIAHYLLEGINRSMRCSYRLSADVDDRLKSYRYPGNVRELRNILFIAATHSVDREIDAALISSIMSHLPHCHEAHSADHEEARYDGMSATTLSAASDESIDKPTTLKDIEAQHIKELLVIHHGNRKKVANVLGISERTVYRKIKCLGIT